jgi:hypothetical protein
VSNQRGGGFFALPARNSPIVRALLILFALMCGPIGWIALAMYLTRSKNRREGDGGFA